MAKRKRYTCGELGNQHGYQCPQCKQGDRLEIAGMAWFTLSHDGADISRHNGDIEWLDGSSASCRNCDWVGKVGQLRIEDMKD